MEIEKYFDTVETNFVEVKENLEKMPEFKNYVLECPQDYLRRLVFLKKMTDTIVVMKIDELTEKEKLYFKYDDWTTLPNNVWKYFNSNTGNILIVDSSGD